MIRSTFLLVALATAAIPGTSAAAAPAVVGILHTYEAKIRVDGRLSTTQVKASDAGQAKKLVQQQFPKATVLSVKRVD
jgi:hypothetical protein